MSSLAAATIVSKSYLSLARVLAMSFSQHHPEIPFFVLLADEVNGFFDPSNEPFHLIALSDLSIPRPERFRFQNAQQPLSYAATPYLLRHLLEMGYEHIIFLKQESLVAGDLRPVFETLKDSSIVLTPHLLKPITGDERVARELNILQSGTFNIGLIGVSGSATARAFLEWWQERTYAHCRLDVAGGMHYEQRWVDMVPSLFEDVHILRDPGANVGHWNLPERVVRLGDGAITIDELPARLFRFSGFDPDVPFAITRHSQRLNMNNVGEASKVFGEYNQLLQAAGYEETRRWPYAFSTFDNGVAIPEVARQAYVKLGNSVEVFGDPFETAPAHSYFRWLNEPVDRAGDRSRRVTRLWQSIYQMRPDVQRAFPEILGRDRAPFIDWTISSGVSEHSIPEEFLIHPHPGVGRSQ